MKNKTIGQKVEVKKEPSKTPPIRVTVCWRCKSRIRPLKRLRDEKGKKTPDYICTLCIQLGFMYPDKPDCSFIIVSGEEQDERREKLEKARQSQEKLKRLVWAEKAKDNEKT